METGREEQLAENPLSYGQQALWLLHKCMPDTGVYNLHWLWTIPDFVDLEIFKKSLKLLVHKHPSLMSLYKDADGEPVQYIPEEKPFVFDEYFVNEMSDEDFEREHIVPQVHQTFDLEKQPPVRWAVFYRKNNKRVVGFFLHHICSDVWSAMVFINQLRDVYKKLKSDEDVLLAEPNRSFLDFVHEQRTFVDSEEGKRQLNYWLEELSGLESTLNLPMDFSRPPVSTCNRGGYRKKLDRSLVSNFSRLSESSGVSLYSLYMATYHLFLYLQSGQKNIFVGSPTAGRDETYAGVFGYFVNPILVCSSIDTSQSVLAFIEIISKKIKTSIENSQYPLSLISEKMSIRRSDSQPQLFQVTFVWDNTNRFENWDNPLVTCDGHGNHCWDMGELGVWDRILINQQVDNFDLSFRFYKLKDEMTLSVEYNSDLFKKSTIERMACHFESLMVSIVENPEKKVSELSLLTKEERIRIIKEWNDTHYSYEDSDLFAKIFENTAKSFPNHSALNFEGAVTTYKELDEKSNQLANYLVDMGVVAENIVGISLDRSPEMIIAILAILKSGGAYLPLDPDYPKDRLLFMIEDAKVSFIVTTAEVKQRLPKSDSHCLCLDTMAEEIQAKSKEAPSVIIPKDSMAYLLYTSGSTGKPKGVMIEQKALSNFVISQRSVFDLSTEDRVLLFASLNFDTSIFAISLSLQYGATLYLAKKDRLIGDGLISYLHDNEISWALLPPPVASSLKPGELNKLKTLVFGGEACSQDLAKSWSKGRDLYNGYGPTETTVWATVAKINGDSAPVIGRPIANTQCYVLDKNRNLQPVGVPGELCVGGDSLARGYLNRPDLTKEKFIPNPFDENRSSRLYKTGDLVRYLEDGNIEFLGRIDHQIKIRGFRVELGEIESILREHVTVEDVLVVACDGEDGSSEEKYLAAYVVKNPNEKTNIQVLKRYLKERLPGYMVPAAFVLLDAFPLTPNEKIDRKKLPKPTVTSGVGSNAFIPPRNEIERIIAEIWTDVLPVAKVSIYENFFDLGGHSLLLAKVFGKLPDMLREKLTVVDLFKYPTVLALSHYLENDKEDDAFYLQRDNHFERLRLRRRLLENLIGMEVAVVGMAGRFPGSDTVEQFWCNIAGKEESISFYSIEELREAGVPDKLLNNPNYVRAQSAISDVKGFDAAFFGYSPREAQITDPQQRIFLECAWEALEDGCCVPEKFDGNIGVYAGVGKNNYMIDHLSRNVALTEAVGDYSLSIGNDKDFLSSRISYKLNLDGPAVVVQTACSTSLVAVHTACQALLDEECDAAIAGGVSLGRLEKSGYLYQQGMIFSPDGHCRAFDEKAKGTVQGQGAGAVLLKRLDDALLNNDHIYAVIKGSATNNDGANKAGYTSPAVEGQAKSILSALSKADISADDITYVETHGTATPLGDPVEIEGLKQAYLSTATERRPCAIGSVKTNIGHLDAAAGVVGLIKTAKALENKKLPPSLHFQKSNPEISFSKTPFYVNTELTDWPGDQGPRYAGVSSFGIGGTNAHVVLREPPHQDPSEMSHPWHLLLLSAKTLPALELMTERFVNYLKTNKDNNFSNVCYSLQVGRKRFDYRRYLVCRNEDEAIAELERPNHKDVTTRRYDQTPRKVAFMFSGQGSQYINMAKHLYQVELGFREEVRRCRNILKVRFSHFYSELDTLDFSAQTDKLHETYITQPTLFVLEYALAKTLMSWGVEPSVMIGHSIGEYVAACLSGVFTLEQALGLVATRGKLIQSLPKGEMLSAQLTEEEARCYLTDQISLAALNGEQRCVFSGQTEAILDLQHRLSVEKIQNRLLYTSHAFHSHMMDPVLENFKDSVADRDPQKPTIPFISSTTGRYITDDEATSAEYWAQHLRREVRFNGGLHTLFDHASGHDNQGEGLILLEIGPGKVLSTLAKQHPAKQKRDIVLSTMRNASEEISDIQQLLKVLGRLWENNVDIRWDLFHSARQRYRVPLPTYPFERKPYWINSRPLLQAEESESELESNTLLQESSDGVALGVNSESPRDDIERRVAAEWALCLGVSDIGINDDFFDLGGDSLVAVTLVDRLTERFDTAIASHVLIQNSTVAELADHIKLITRHPDMLGEAVHSDVSSDKKELGHASPLVLIQKGSVEKRPLFMVHPIGGEVYFYRDLGLQLGVEQPLFAFQAPGLAGNVEPLDRVPEIAKTYIKALRLTGAKPPYLLGGSSFGGLVAYEMAQQFKAEGDEVALVVMIDTPAPQDMPTHVTDSASILQYLLQDKIDLSLEELRQFEPKAQIDFILEKARHEDKRNALPPHLSVSLFCTWIAHQEATFSYSPKTYDGDVLYYRHTEPMANFPPAPHKPWKSLVSGDFQVHGMPGNHITMNYPPCITALANHLRLRLRRY